MWQWDRDKRHGNGLLIMDEGRSRYEGMWHGDWRNGRGLETLPDGSKYAGEYVDDIRQGR
jgi:hypothetical protein